MIRRDAIADALDRLAPEVPAHERDEVIGHALASPGLRKARPETAAWLSLVAYLRHSYTDYEALLAEGYGVEAARHFCRTQINQVLAAWGSRRQVGEAADGDDDSDAGPS